eukprot:875365-Pleurochrysis_carterae.AAC.1
MAPRQRGASVESPHPISAHSSTRLSISPVRYHYTADCASLAYTAPCFRSSCPSASHGALSQHSARCLF